MKIVSEDLIGPPVIDATHAYRDLADNSTAIARAEAPVRGPNTLAAEDVAYLADLVAITSGQAEWCERIRVGIILREGQVPFRDGCLLGGSLYIDIECRCGELELNCSRVSFPDCPLRVAHLH